jgi:RNA polymerase sigma-70 factor (ECF subfamily)
MIDFTALYEEQYPVVLRRCQQAVKVDSGEAEEIAQEVFLKIFQKMDGFRGKSNVKTWVHKITTNAILDYFRQKGRSVVIDFEKPPESAIPAEQLSNVLFMEKYESMTQKQKQTLLDEMEGTRVRKENTLRRAQKVLEAV